ncbi:MAG: class C beta-lactamase-related serine hydrolase [Burkholderiales bacterium]|nr:MAG: class C beta-lactamase-related serine hydrolase [Burkholderiales bacterium]
MLSSSPSRLVRLSAALLACAALNADAQTSSTDLAALIKSIPSGTGYAAWDLCSRAISVGDDFNRVKTQYTAPKVQPLPWFWTLFHTDTKVDVSAAALLYPRKGIYRPGMGCTLITPQVTEAAVRAQPFKPVAPAPADTRPWPLGEGAAQMDKLSPARQAVLQKAAQAMFSETTTDVTKKVNTNALLVAQDGQLVYEQYAAPFDRSRQELGWSMTKSLTALIAGVMERDGLLAVDAPVGLKAWQGTNKAAITWRQLLNMAPGIEWKEGAYGIGQDDTTQMLFSQADQCAWAASKPLATTPGTVFNYSTGFANLAMCRLKELAGGTHQQIYDYYQRKLFAPLGIRGGYIEADAAGTPVGGARGMLRPVDWLRLGQLVADGGQWQGRTILNPAYVQFLVSPSPADSGYGGYIWRQPTSGMPQDLRDKLPPDLVFFWGFQQQHVAIVPSRKLVLLRQGVSFDEDTAMRQIYQLVIDLLDNP